MKPLVKVQFKKNWMLWAIFTGITVLYLALIILTFDKINEAMSNGSMSDMMNSFGYDSSTWSNIMLYTANMFFGQLVLILPMVFYLIICNKIIYKPVDDTSMSSYMSSSISRKQYVASTGIFLASSIIAMFALVFGIGSLLFSFSGPFDALSYLNLCVYSMLLTLAVAFIVFFLSFILTGVKGGLIIIIGFPIMLYLLASLSKIKVLHFLKYVSPFSWGDATEIAKGTFGLWWMFDLIFIGITVVSFVFASKIFNKKQLSI